MEKRVLVILCIYFSLCGCASLATLDPGGCGTPPLEDICLGKTVVPIEQEDLFLTASNEAINAIASNQFKLDLENFIDLHSKNGAHKAAWDSIDAESIPGLLLEEVKDMQISTFGGIKGLFYKIFYGTQAFEGDGIGPILLNRWSLPRPTASIANTIVHEAAHRIGLSHPSVDKDRAVANCEPPYLIGSLIEKQIAGAGWSAEGHCVFIESN